MSDTISKIKLSGVTYTIDDPSKASIEQVLEFGQMTSENNSLLTFANSKLDELLNRINGSTKSQDFYECVSVNTSTKTWSGYKAILADGVYSFEETVTEGLNYGMAFTPTVGAIYNADATVVITALYKKVDPITLNDTNCLIFIDGSSLSNQALAANKHEITFGNGVSLQDGYINISNNQSGQILTTAKSDGWGGILNTWTWDYYFMADGSRLDCSGHSEIGWTLEASKAGQSLYFRGYSANSQLLGVTYNRNELIGLSMQYQNGILHVWNKGKYVGQCTPTFTDCTGSSFGIGCIADGDYDRMADKIKLFRFSNVARYTPGLDFDVPEWEGVE